MNDNLHQRLAMVTDLHCQVARRFSERPTLLEVAGDILVQAWQQRQLATRHDPRALYLTTLSPTGKAWVRPLPQVLVERYCLRRTLNLPAEEAFLSMLPDAATADRLTIDLHEVELLINETAPALLETYRQRLANFWSRASLTGETPWRWYANVLREQMRKAIDSHARDGNLSTFALAVASLVNNYPSTAERATWPNTADLKVNLLGIDFSPDAQFDADLASAVLIEQQSHQPERQLTLLYTLSGRLLAFPSRQALLETINRNWPDSLRSSPRQVNLQPTTQSVFEGQALGLLSTQLQLIDAIAGKYRSQQDAEALANELDRLTSLIDLCDTDEAARRQPLVAELPAWLRDAASRPLMRYSTLLVDVAQGYQDANGQFWLDGIDTSEAYANRLLAARLASDHPAEPLDPEHVHLVNYQTTAVAAAGQDAVIPLGEVTPVTYTLAQLAIANLGLLKAGRVELSTTDGSPLPAWMTETYLRQLVRELDVGAHYPAMLRERLLDDATERARREKLFTLQLHSQLPALAMELHLRGVLQDADISSHIGELFSPQASPDTPRWALRPLGFIKAPGSPADRPRNTWLIEPQAVTTGPCLLYRPLHPDSLLFYRDRLALLDAIATPGVLQDDLLRRLPAEDRRFYAHGGFLEPHLFTILEDTSAVPWQTPAPVTLALTDAEQAPGKALYLACVNESIQRFAEHAASSAQARWDSWKELGWLLFNTLLPLAGSTLGKVAWLAQMEVALASYVEDDADPTRHRLAMVDLLVNIAMLLFSHSIMRLQIEQASPSLASEDPTPAQPAAEAVLPVIEHDRSPLDFGWARADHRLDSHQRQALEALKASPTPAELGSAVPNGPMQGLYLYRNSFYALLDNSVYEVMHDDGLIRLIGPQQQPGPWLMRDEVGRWKVDLRLRLKGGQPLSEQLRKLRLEKQAALQASSDQLQADKAQMADKLHQVATIEKLLVAASDDSLLARCQEKIQQLSAFWVEHLERLQSHNTLQPLKEFKQLQAHALYQDSICQRLLFRILRERFTPPREQMLQIARQQAEGEELSPADIRIVTQRVGSMLPLLDRMIQSNTALEQLQINLKRLASAQQPQISSWSELASSMPASLEKELVLRFLRLESLVNRLTLTFRLSDQAKLWRDRFWSGVQLAIAQSAKLPGHANLDEEAKVRVLRSLEQQYLASSRQLDNFASLVPEEDAQHTLQGLRDEVSWLNAETRQQLSQLPDYPPVCTLTQLRSRLPGLIETAEHGLLLGEPRAGTPDIVDIPGPDSKMPTRTYQLEHEQWVEVQPAAPAPPVGKRKLTQLLKGSTALMNTAREAMQRSVYARYLPVEIEETLLQQHDLLMARADAIEQALTASNQTDEARQGLDAEGVARSLRSLADQVKSHATQRRIEAALAQPPRMGEVQFLLEKGEVQIRAEGARVRLAKVPGRPADFIDEYSISHQGKVHWYAHFHYLANDSAKVDFTVGHLKTAEQRFMTGKEVYYSEITHAAGRRLFFDL